MLCQASFISCLRKPPNSLRELNPEVPPRTPPRCLREYSLYECIRRRLQKHLGGGVSPSFRKFSILGGVSMNCKTTNRRGKDDQLKTAASGHSLKNWQIATPGQNLANRCGFWEPVKCGIRGGRKLGIGGSEEGESLPLHAHRPVAARESGYRG